MIWRAVVGWAGLYEVSDGGHIRNLLSGRVLKGSFDGRYRSVALPLGDGRYLRKRVHALVLNAFVGPCPTGMEGCHGDGNSQNNALSNLRWDTRRNNCADMKLHGTFSAPPRNDVKGERHGAAKLTAGAVERIFGLSAAGCTHQQIADWLGGVSRSLIGMILNRRRWAHLEAA